MSEVRARAAADGGTAHVTADGRRLRVLVLALGRRGGLNDYAWMMTRALTRIADVAVVGSSYAEDRERWAALGLPRLEVPTFNGVLGLLASFLAFGRFAAILRFARGFAPDVVYYPGGHAWKPLLDRVLPAAPIVLTVHDPELHAGEDSFLHRLLADANRLRVDGYVLLNEVQGRTFAARNGLEADRLAIIPLGPLADPGLEPVALGRIRGLEGLADHEGRYLLFLGRIERYKGLEILLAAHGSLVADNALPLVVAGSGVASPQERALLDAAAPGRVTFVNRWLDDLEIVTLVSHARFVVLPYVHATQSGVVPLAASFGVPAIVTDAGGLPEQVRAGESGFVCAAGDAEALADLLARASQMPLDEYDAMATAAREFAAEQGDWDVAATSLVQFAAALNR